jgi:hypothetical protein
VDCVSSINEVGATSALVEPHFHAAQMNLRVTPDRHGTLIDASEKIIGGVLGIFAARATLYLRYRKRSP